MNPIITGNENLIPTKHKEGFNYWTLISNLKWVDRSDINRVGGNPVAPIHHWSPEVYENIKNDSVFHYEQLDIAMKQQKFWEYHPEITNGEAEQIIWHIIAKGKDIYEAILKDTTFAITYVNEACGFMEFIKKYK